MTLFWFLLISFVAIPNLAIRPAGDPSNTERIRPYKVAIPNLAIRPAGDRRRDGQGR